MCALYKAQCVNQSTRRSDFVVWWKPHNCCVHSTFHITEMESTGPEVKVERYVVITNISKKNNIKALINAAAAYNFEAILVGWKNAEELHIADDIKFIQLDSIDQLVVFLQERSIPLVGVEIMDGARSVLDNPFEGSVAFMPGNEGTGLSRRQKEISNSFIYIPQYGDGTASLNVYVATTLILHRYNLWLSTARPGL